MEDLNLEFSQNSPIYTLNSLKLLIDSISQDIEKRGTCCWENSYIVSIKNASYVWEKEVREAKSNQRKLRLLILGEDCRREGREYYEGKFMHSTGQL